MAKVVVLGAGVSGHTAITYLKKYLGKNHEIVIISPNSNYQWVPSNIWVGVGLMKPDQVKFKLAPVYKKLGIIYKQALALSIHPEGNNNSEKGFVTIKYVDGDKKNQEDNVSFILKKTFAISVYLSFLPLKDIPSQFQNPLKM